VSLVGPLVRTSLAPRRDLSVAGQSPSPQAVMRIAQGDVGDADALRAYVFRANRLAVLSLVAAVALLGPLRATPWVKAIAVGALLLGALLDRARANLATRLRIDRDVLRVTRGPWEGRAIARSDVVAVGFGAPGRADRRAPETFWRGDFHSAGASHIVCIRLARRGRGPRRLIVPEVGRPEARAAVARLRAWASV
jgi:hypothetical protein